MISRPWLWRPGRWAGLHWAGHLRQMAGLTACRSVLETGLTVDTSGLYHDVLLYWRSAVFILGLMATGLGVHETWVGVARQ